jgi:hypothetical protein
MFRLQGYYLLCRPFRMAFGYTNDFLLRAKAAAMTGRSHDPEHATPAGYHTCPV